LPGKDKTLIFETTEDVADISSKIEITTLTDSFE
jgi:hypothetical protein